MSKRLSPNQSDGSDDLDDSQTGFDDVAVKRRRLVEFESVRLLSVTGVNDIESKKSRVQLYKLSETVRNKDRIIKHKDKEIERLRQRQTTDEDTSCTINRHWNNIDEQLRLVLLRGTSASEVDDLLNRDSQNGAGSRFLEEVVQMEEGERQAVYDKRVQTSIRLLNQVLKQSTTRSEQQKMFSKKLVAFMEASTSGGETSKDDVLNELVHKNSVLSDENAVITKECASLQQQLSKTTLKLREAEDKQVQLETRNQELMQEVDEMKHDLEKSQRLVNKLDFKLYNVIKEQSTRTHNVEENGCGTTSNSKANGLVNGDSDLKEQSDDAKTECEQQTELAASRLAEIKELNERILKCVEDLEREKMKATERSLEEISRNKEFEELQQYFSVAMDEIGRVKEELHNCQGELEIVRDEQFNRVESMKHDEQLAIRKVLSSSEQINKESLQVSNDYHELRMELEKTGKNQPNSDTREKDVKTWVASIRAQNNTLKSESQRLKKRWKDTVNLLAKCQKDLDVERQRIARSLLVEIDEDQLLSPVPVRNLDSDDEHADESRLRERITDLKTRLDAFKSVPSETRQLAEVLAREKRLQLENDRLTQNIRRLANMERREKIRYFETEYQRETAVKDAELATVTKERDDLLNAEGALNQELESIGQALEELQEQNSNLMKQKQYLEEEKMQMMGDRISSSQMQQKLKDENTLLEAQIQNLVRQMQTQACEHKHVVESLIIAKESMQAKTKENGKLNRTLEITRKQVMEQSLKSEGLVTSNDKLKEQLSSLQDAVVSRSQQVELTSQKARRLEEENSQLRKRIERARKSMKLGSTDAVYMEEIKQLKEVLTCPSCKVNRKDAILTKCFHVFCMKCLKTRYDTRQRKCPKCNAGFGANDFQRAYIG